MPIRGKLREAITSKSILATAAIALFALAFVPSQALAASPPPSYMTLDMSGLVVTPSAGVIGTFTLHLEGPTFQLQGNLVQGVAAGSYNGVDLQGGWSYNPATGKTLMKVAAADGSFTLNLAFLNLNPNVGFTFQGTLFVNGQGPVMLVSYPNAPSLVFA